MGHRRGPIAQGARADSEAACASAHGRPRARRPPPVLSGIRPGPSTTQNRCEASPRCCVLYMFWINTFSMTFIKWQGRIQDDLAQAAMSPPIEITLLAKAGGPLTKRISLAADGSLKSDGSACLMGGGDARRAQFSDLHAFADCIGNLAQHQAVALGSLRLDLPDKV